MYIESIIFKRGEHSEWEKGYYVGETDNCENSVILDEKYQPLEKNGKGLWDYKADIRKRVLIRC